MKNDELKGQLDYLGRFSSDISENTVLYSYIKQLNDLLYSDGENKLFEKKYKKTVEETEKNKINSPFLSVIIRTQGNREVGLREALLCLRAQTDQDFEVILIGHRVEEVNKVSIQEIINGQPLEFRNKIKYIQLDSGTRTTPINLGFANASGKYISVFDDDDLLFDNWVEKFHESSRENDGKILHAFALAQKWKRIQALEDKKIAKVCYVAIEAPTSQFCEKFDYLSQMVLNRCPLMSLAFPSYIFKKLGMIFNESLNVTEDWEYFMRVVTITGIVDIEEATSIYRLWVNAENSVTLHNQKIWTDTYLNIQNKMNTRAMLLPQGYAAHLISLIRRCEEDKLKMPMGFPKLNGLLYYGADEKFSDERMIHASNSVYSPQLEMNFKVTLEGEHLKYFRFDPCEYGGFIFEDIKITMNVQNEGKIEVSLDECIHNGIRLDNGIYFLHYDPQISWKYEGGEEVNSVSVKGTANMEISQELVNRGISYYSIRGKIKRKVKKIVNRLHVR